MSSDSIEYLDNINIDYGMLVADPNDNPDDSQSNHENSEEDQIKIIVENDDFEEAKHDSEDTE